MPLLAFNEFRYSIVRRIRAETLLNCQTIFSSSLLQLKMSENIFDSLYLQQGVIVLPLFIVIISVLHDYYINSESGIDNDASKIKNKKKRKDLPLVKFT